MCTCVRAPVQCHTCARQPRPHRHACAHGRGAWSLGHCQQCQEGRVKMLWRGCTSASYWWMSYWGGLALGITGGTAQGGLEVVITRGMAGGAGTGGCWGTTQAAPPVVMVEAALVGMGTLRRGARPFRGRRRRFQGTARGGAGGRCGAARGRGRWAEPDRGRTGRPSRPPALRPGLGPARSPGAGSRAGARAGARARAAVPGAPASAPPPWPISRRT